MAGLSAVDVQQAAEIRSDERFLMGFEEAVETTFEKVKWAEEKEVDVEIEIMVKFLSVL